MACAFLALSFPAVSANAGEFTITPYLQHPASDAMTVMFFTKSESGATVRCRPVGGGDEFVVSAPGVWAESLTNNAACRGEDVGYWEGQYKHRVRFENLQPGTVYDYSVELESGEKYSNTFKTAPDRNTPVRIIAYADSETLPGDAPTEEWDAPTDENGKPLHDGRYYVGRREGFASNIVAMVERKPDLYVCAGDLVARGGVQENWDEFWSQMAGGNGVGLNDPAGSTPIVSAIGNHDLYDCVGGVSSYNASFGGKTALDRFFTYFEFNANGVDYASASAGSEATSHDYGQMFHREDYGPVTLIFLSTNTRETFDAFRNGDPWAPDFKPGSLQYNWLTNNLAEAQRNSRFTIVVNHHSPYSVGKHNGANDGQSAVPVRNALTEAMLKYGVSAWICGHDEMIEHSQIAGTEILPDGTSRRHLLNVYDLGTGGDGLRGKVSVENPYEVFRPFKDQPEVWENGVLVDGGVHYSHAEINIAPNEDGVWECSIQQAYVFVNKIDGTPSTFERRLYRDKTVVAEGGETTFQERFGEVDSETARPKAGERLEFDLPAPSPLWNCVVEGGEIVKAYVDSSDVRPGKLVVSGEYASDEEATVKVFAGSGVPGKGTLVKTITVNGVAPAEKDARVILGGKYSDTCSYASPTKWKVTVEPGANAKASIEAVADGAVANLSVEAGLDEGEETVKVWRVDGGVRTLAAIYHVSVCEPTPTPEAAVAIPSMAAGASEEVTTTGISRRWCCRVADGDGDFISASLRRNDDGTATVTIGAKYPTDTKRSVFVYAGTDTPLDANLVKTISVSRILPEERSVRIPLGGTSSQSVGFASSATWSVSGGTGLVTNKLSATSGSSTTLTLFAGGAVGEADVTVSRKVGTKTEAACIFHVEVYSPDPVPETNVQFSMASGSTNKVNTTGKYLDWNCVAAPAGLVDARLARNTDGTATISVAALYASGAPVSVNVYAGSSTPGGGVLVKTITVSKIAPAEKSITLSFGDTHVEKCRFSSAARWTVAPESGAYLTAGISSGSTAEATLTLAAGAQMGDETVTVYRDDGSGRVAAYIFKVNVDEVQPTPESNVNIGTIAAGTTTEILTTGRASVWRCQLSTTAANYISATVDRNADGTARISVTAKYSYGTSLSFDVYAKSSKSSEIKVKTITINGISPEERTVRIPMGGTHTEPCSFYESRNWSVSASPLVSASVSPASGTSTTITLKAGCVAGSGDVTVGRKGSGNSTDMLVLHVEVYEPEPEREADERISLDAPGVTYKTGTLGVHSIWKCDSSNPDIVAASSVRNDDGTAELTISGMYAFGREVAVNIYAVSPTTGSDVLVKTVIVSSVGPATQDVALDFDQTFSAQCEFAAPCDWSVSSDMGDGAEASLAGGKLTIVAGRRECNGTVTVSRVADGGRVAAYIFNVSVAEPPPKKENDVTFTSIKAGAVTEVTTTSRAAHWRCEVDSTVADYVSATIARNDDGTATIRINPLYSYGTKGSVSVIGRSNTSSEITVMTINFGKITAEERKVRLPWGGVATNECAFYKDTSWSVSSGRLSNVSLTAKSGRSTKVVFSAGSDSGTENVTLTRASSGNSTEMVVFHVEVYEPEPEREDDAEVRLVAGGNAATVTTTSRHSQWNCVADGVGVVVASLKSNADKTAAVELSGKYAWNSPVQVRVYAGSTVPGEGTLVKTITVTGVDAVESQLELEFHEQVVRELAFPRACTWSVSKDDSLGASVSLADQTPTSAKFVAEAGMERGEWDVMVTCSGDGFSVVAYVFHVSVTGSKPKAEANKTIAEIPAGDAESVQTTGKALSWRCAPTSGSENFIDATVTVNDDHTATVTVRGKYATSTARTVNVYACNDEKDGDVLVKKITVSKITAAKSDLRIPFGAVMTNDCAYYTGAYWSLKSTPKFATASLPSSSTSTAKLVLTAGIVPGKEDVVVVRKSSRNAATGDDAYTFHVEVYEPEPELEDGESVSLVANGQPKTVSTSSSHTSWRCESSNPGIVSASVAKNADGTAAVTLSGAYAFDEEVRVNLYAVSPTTGNDVLVKEITVTGVSPDVRDISVGMLSTATFDCDYVDDCEWRVASVSGSGFTASIVGSRVTITAGAAASSGAVHVSRVADGRTVAAYVLNVTVYEPQPVREGNVTVSSVKAGASYTVTTDNPAAQWRCESGSPSLLSAAITRNPQDGRASIVLTGIYECTSNITVSVYAGTTATGANTKVKTITVAGVAAEERNLRIAVGETATVTCSYLSSQTWKAASGSFAGAQLSATSGSSVKLTLTGNSIGAEDIAVQRRSSSRYSYETAYVFHVDVYEPEPELEKDEEISLTALGPAVKVTTTGMHANWICESTKLEVVAASLEKNADGTATVSISAKYAYCAPVEVRIYAVSPSSGERVLVKTVTVAKIAPEERTVQLVQGGTHNLVYEYFEAVEWSCSHGGNIEVDVAGGTGAKSKFEATLRAGDATGLETVTLSRVDGGLATPVCIVHVSVAEPTPVKESDVTIQSVKAGEPFQVTTTNPAGVWSCTVDSDGVLSADVVRNSDGTATITIVARYEYGTERSITVYAGTAATGANTQVKKITVSRITAEEHSVRVRQGREVSFDCGFYESVDWSLSAATCVTASLSAASGKTSVLTLRGKTIGSEDVVVYRKNRYGTDEAYIFHVEVYGREPGDPTHAIVYEGVDGAVNPNPADFTADELPLTLLPPERDGYIFAGWSPNGGVIPAGTDSDVVFTASWKSKYACKDVPVDVPQATNVVNIKVGESKKFTVSISNSRYWLLGTTNGFEKASASLDLATQYDTRFQGYSLRTLSSSRAVEVTIVGVAAGEERIYLGQQYSETSDPGTRNFKVNVMFIVNVEAEEGPWAEVSRLLGADVEFENEPEIVITSASFDGSEIVSGIVSVSVTDGGSPHRIDPKRLASMFRATSDLSDWDGHALDVEVPVGSVTTNPDGTYGFKVKVDCAETNRAFLRILVK